MGEFGFITADGIYHVTVYATDENGDFRILKMKNIKVGFRELHLFLQATSGPGRLCPYTDLLGVGRLGRLEPPARGDKRFSQNPSKPALGDRPDSCTIGTGVKLPERGAVH